MDAFQALAALKNATKEAPAVISEEPAAPDTHTMLGLVKTGSPVPVEDRGTKAIQVFENARIRETILEHLRKGYPLKTAASAVGISTGQLRTWKNRGLRGVEPFATFLHELESAQAVGAIALLDTIRAAGEGAPDHHGIWKNDWHASKWLLERQDPDQFVEVSKSISAHVEVPAGATVDVRGMSDEDLEKLVEVLDRAPVIDVGTEDED